jgi:hypothetical protein
MATRSFSFPFAAAALLASCATTPVDISPFAPGLPGSDAGREAAAEEDAATPHTEGGAHTDTGVHTTGPGDATPLSQDTSTPPPKDAGGPPPSTDAGSTPDAAGVDAAIYNTPEVCTSGMTWALGNTKSALMNPGLACDTCHVLGGSASGYEFDVAGTVYPTAHEPDLCDGTATPTIEITDAMGTLHTLTVNSAGNFYNFDYLGVGAIPTPYKVKVVSGSASRAMLTPLTTGDCNSCHTEQGAQAAPGRVMAP